ncbi:MAG TPA: hypothetical protein VMV69_24920 [Pirellulales bacterium]|nr:hypothetical protein [Pirellulales bacterium]
MNRTKGAATAYIGTDHGLTDPDAVEAMAKDDVDVFFVVDYDGIYHPKVAWLSGGPDDVLWIGSNNLTEDGLLFNVEFATVTRFDGAEEGLEKWYQHVQSASIHLDGTILEEYRRERSTHAKKTARIGAFTWSRRVGKGRSRRAVRRERGRRTATLWPRARGDLIVEIMPRETGSDGKQVQLPKEVAVDFFGLPDRVGSHMVACHHVLFDLGSSRDEIAHALADWLAQSQPCLFGQMEAKQHRLAFCVLNRHQERAMTKLEQRVLAAVGGNPRLSSWEDLTALFRGDREAFYLLACDGAPAGAGKKLDELAALAEQVRLAVRESYEIVPCHGGANIISLLGTQIYTGFKVKNVRRILQVEIERTRGEIARSERSALAPAA